MSYASVNGYRIHYESAGPEVAPAVILIHGLTSCLRVWKSVMPCLAPHFRVIALDLLGHGESEKPRRAPHSIEQQGELVVGLLETLHIDRAALVGHSMGGQIALWIASHHPARVERLAVVTAVTEATLSRLANFNNRLVIFGVTFPVIGRPLAQFFGSPRNPLRKLVVERLYYACPQPESVFHEIYDEQFRDDNYPSKIASIKAIHRYYALDDAAQITMPMLIVGADKDRVVPPGQALALKARVSSAELVMVPGCGHLIQYDAPDALNAALSRFLADSRV
jgi:pimeloyl-ACP methyl ester carboxylesterase